ncbi:hypothetical protein CBP51_13930 [Cellvibrio mixtus]|uniref:Uncharacterized protein n=1 Tax=Cellvibrio mixtus TaxID=39650 RepID=A0A266Q4N1_9GAMM|nr:hypothetical protein [Cellvibrio mixtus]OZY84309.1 hypothetical protein CBP51_13930 [Cellvibrio mixtus]
MKVTFEAQKELIEKLEAYLAGSLSHEDIQKQAWNYANHSPKVPTPKESNFWATVFAIIHLADEQHWCDGCTKRDLMIFCHELKMSISI